MCEARPVAVLRGDEAEVRDDAVPRADAGLDVFGSQAFLPDCARVEVLDSFITVLVFRLNIFPDAATARTTAGIPEYAPLSAKDIPKIPAAPGRQILYTGRNSAPAAKPCKHLPYHTSNCGFRIRSRTTEIISRRSFHRTQRMKSRRSRINFEF